MYRLQVWIHPLGIDKIPATDMLIGPLKACNTVPQPRVTPREQRWWETTNFQK
jgi:hypothetical protein